MFKKLFLVTILEISLFASIYTEVYEEREDAQNAIRDYHHGVSLVEYNNGTVNNPDINYYASWAMAENGRLVGDDETTLDLKISQISFEWGTLHDKNYGDFLLEQTTNINDSAQEPASTTNLYKGSKQMMSVWEDGRKRDGEYRMEIHGRLHNQNGTALNDSKSDWVLDHHNATYKTHSPVVTHIVREGSNQDLYVVAYVEEHGSGGHIKVRIFDQEGNKQGSNYMVTDSGNSWWPVITTDENNHVFIAWVTKDGEDIDMRGCILSVSSNYTISCQQTSSIYNIKPYNYQVTWLENIERFLMIANKDQDNSTVKIMTINGSLKGSKDLNKPIVREAQLAIRWENEYGDNAYKVIYPSGKKDIAVLKVTSNHIVSQQNHSIQALQDVVTFSTQEVKENENGTYKVVNSTESVWPRTGIAAKFVQDTDGQEIWTINGEKKNKVLFLFNDKDGYLTDATVNVEVGF